MQKRLTMWLAALTVVFVYGLTAQEQAAVITPAKPTIGDEIVITYNAGSAKATLASATDISAEVLVARSGDVPVLIEVPLKREGKLWKGSMKLKEEKGNVLLVRFVAGDQRDDNKENVLLLLVHGANGKPLEGANLTNGSILASGSFVDFKLAKDLEAAKSAFAKERELYPDNLAAMFQLWWTLMREKPGDETKEMIKQELEKEYAKGNDKFASDFASWYEQVGMKEKAADIRKAAIGKDPKGKAAQQVALNEVFKERDAAKRASLLEKFLADFPVQGGERENYQNMMFSFKMSALLAAKQYDEAYAVLESMPKKDGNMYNSLAWPLIEKGEQLEKAVSWAKKGVDLLKNPDPASKPPYVSLSQWKKSSQVGLGMVQDTYAYGLYQMGKYPEALGAYEEAYALTNGEQSDINQRLVECYVKNGSFSKAISLSEECIRKGKSNEKLVEAYKTAYVKVKGSEQGFEAALEQAKATAKSDMKKDVLKNLVNKPAVDFALKGLDGKIVKLSALKGKVVVVDFWATWCGPCKASFPYLQKVYEKYKANPNVVILAVNTWENVSGKEREDLVKKFMAENKYTFPVIYDQGFVEKYEVEGIPTKFVIDKKGMIQFKSIGFLGGEKMIEEMTMQLEMLLDDKFYSMN
jgi:thiol-disulfide isomerase/thioredoxin